MKIDISKLLEYARQTTQMSRKRISVSDIDNLEEVLAMYYELHCENPMEKDENMMQIIQKASLWLQGKGKPWLMLLGGIGNGKSTMLKAIAGTLLFASKQEQRLTMTTSLELIEEANDNPDHYKMLRNADFLAIDELGVEPQTIKHYGNISSPIVDLVYYRYDRRMPTLFSTNYNQKEIKDRYGERVEDRLFEQCSVILFKNQSYRKHNGN